jgi:hypothetical protein
MAAPSILQIPYTELLRIREAEQQVTSNNPEIPAVDEVAALQSGHP